VALVDPAGPMRRLCGIRRLELAFFTASPTEHRISKG
jgi:hypothetical protein